MMTQISKRSGTSLPRNPLSGCRTALKGHGFGRTWSTLLLLLLASVPAAADRFPSAVEVEGTRMELQGTATFRWLFFTLYDGAFYLPPETSAEKALQDVPKKLVLHYHREIPVEKIVEAGNRLLEKNAPPEVLAELQPKLERINAAYRTPADGDRYALSYLPGKGTTLSFNGEPVVTIEGAQFARYYFRIWLGEKPVGTDFRDALLGVS